MNVNSINPSFRGYIQVNIGKDGKFINKNIVFNTNNIAFDDLGNIYMGDKQFHTKHNFQELKKAVLKADATPDRIIDVEKCNSKVRFVDYEI